MQEVYGGLRDVGADVPIGPKKCGGKRRAAEDSGPYRSFRKIGIYFRKAKKRWPK